jgi:hypothetical protein
MMREHRFWQLIILLSAIAAGVVALALPGTVLSLIVILWFLLVCPGLMVVLCLNLKETVAIWTLALALSVAIDAIVASIALYAGIWSPTGILYTLITICFVWTIAQFIVTSLNLNAVIEPFATNHWKLVSLLLLFFLFVLVASPGAWASSSNLRAAASNPALSHTARKPASVSATATPAPGVSPVTSGVDAVIVMDNVNQITTFDPQADRYKAAQLLVNLMQSGDRVGIVGITSTPVPSSILALRTLQKSSDKALVNNTLSANTFGPADPSPNAYFTPALQLAGSMLLASAPNHRKLIMIFTDALALSGDQNACNISPDAYHNWFCAVQALEQKGIAVALVGFTTPGSATALQPVLQFFSANGEVALPIADTSDLASQLTLAYRNLLSPARPASIR